MSIRGRLRTLAIGGVVPLLVIGLIVLWAVWRGKQKQLDETLEQQAELAAVIFDRWLDSQYQPLRTIASYPPEHFSDTARLDATLKATLINRKPDVETDWTRGEGRYVLALAFPLEGGGAVIARIDGIALKEPLQGMTLPERAVITLLDQRNRVVYRSQTPETAIGMDLTESGVLSALHNHITSVISVKSSIDGVERVYGLARVAAQAM